MSDVHRSGHSEGISPAIFDHLVELAALELAPDEAEYLRRELNNHRLLAGGEQLVHCVVAVNSTRL